MNAQINQRTFTDQIPAYYEKTQFLKSLGRQDLADIHDYFFYKRLLSFYERAYEMSTPERTQYLEQLTQMIRSNREHYARVFGCIAADARDYRKMRRFLRSPASYIRMVRLNERMIIPLKVKIKRVLKRIAKIKDSM